MHQINKLDEINLSDIELIRRYLFNGRNYKLACNDAKTLLRAYELAISAYEIEKVERDRWEKVAKAFEEMAEDSGGDIHSLKNEIASLKAALAASVQSDLKDVIGGHVEIIIRSDGKVLWVNHDDGCILRIHKIENLELHDSRIGEENHQ